ncbi:MAG: PIN-like domain-containing protein, partial [Terracidiphilus sp.]
MKDLFRQYHRPTDAEQKTLWEECIFALDANALLNVYRYADSTRNDFFGVLEGLGARVWVPYHAAREFYKNRIAVIREQTKKYDELRSNLSNTLSSLRGGDFSKSAFLKIDEIEALLKPVIEQAQAKIQEGELRHPDLLHNDPYLDRLSTLIDSSVGAEPEAKAFDEACNRAQVRIDKQQPPGYRDVQKPAPDRYGDVLIWFELLEHAQSTKKSIILVTDDEKDDWWQIIAGEKLGPRPELRDEMWRAVGVEFQLASPARFMEVAGNQLNVSISKSSVDDAAKVAAEVRDRAFSLDTDFEGFKVSGDLREPSLPQKLAQYREVDRVAQNAIVKWVVRRMDITEVSLESGRYVDLMFRARSGSRFSVWVLSRRLAMAGMLLTRVREAFLQAYYDQSRGDVDNYALFVVAESEKKALEAALLLSKRHIEPIFTISIG